MDLTNTYDVVQLHPVFVIDKITMRKNAAYHALLPGGTEHRLLMGAPRTPTIYKALREARYRCHERVLYRRGQRLARRGDCDKEEA